MNRSAVLVALVAVGLVTARWTVPTLPAGEVTVMEVSLLTVKLGLEMTVEPKLTEVAVVKPVPVMVTLVPPATSPVDGETPVTVGTGM